MDTEKIDKIRRDMKILAQNADILAADADAFPAIMQNTQRLKACIRMMEMALGQVTLTPQKQPRPFSPDPESV